MRKFGHDGYLLERSDGPVVLMPLAEAPWGQTDICVHDLNDEHFMLIVYVNFN
jgi:hypothetical protein